MNDTKISIELLFGHVETELRYVQTAPNCYACESRSKHFDRAGDLQSVTQWERSGTIENVPPDLAYLLAGG